MIFKLHKHGGAGIYTITFGDVILIIDADANGYFELPSPPTDLPLHAYARRVKIQPIGGISEIRRRFGTA
jgi:hypothetical protein